MQQQQQEKMALYKALHPGDHYNKWKLQKKKKKKKGEIGFISFEERIDSLNQSSWGQHNAE